ncbi:MAG: glycoside hydrolase family 5 protein [Ruminococcaceae bacterium]|nr:glycoside hydrolase family 5 protein [Oscillospiraceae bacterium]
MKKITGLECGMGIGGWLTNYKRFNVLPEDRRLKITVGDMEHFESYITERDIEYIASLGFDHIRLGFDQIVLEESPFIYRGEIITILKNFVLWCKKYSLRPVLNMHKAVGNYCDILEESGLMQTPALQERFIAVWLKLEEVFANDSDVVFELLNEVVSATADEWNSLAERTLAAIRAKNSERIVVIGGIEWNNPPGLDSLKVYDDENVIYTFHSYAPFEFTHQRGVLQRDPLYYNRAMSYPSDDIERYRDYHRVVHGNNNAYAKYDKMDIEYIRDELAPAKRFIERNPDKILWCGEFGTIRHADITSRENWMHDMISVLKEWDIPYCVWNYLSTPNDGNRFSLVDDDNRKILSERLAKTLIGEF